MNCGFGGKIKTQSFQKLFLGGHLFVFVEYLCKRSPKIKTKNIKNYSSILAIVNHRNWLDDSTPLTYFLNLAEVESRTQSSRPRPRTQKKSEAKDSLSEDGHSRGQAQECSRPRPRTKDTRASALQK